MSDLVWSLAAVILALVLLKATALYLSTREKLAVLSAEEKDKERKHQITVASDDYKARHNDRNILMVGQSELVNQIMAANKEFLKIVCDTTCKYSAHNPKEHYPDAPSQDYFRPGPSPSPLG